MIRDKLGEGLRVGHRKETRRTIVNREGLNSPRVSSDLEGNLEDLRHPSRDRIGSSQPMQAEKAAREATMATGRATRVKGSALDWTTGHCGLIVVLERRRLRHRQTPRRREDASAARINGSARRQVLAWVVPRASSEKRSLAECDKLLPDPHLPDFH
jgi:hypothetical protein